MKRYKKVRQENGFLRDNFESEMKESERQSGYGREREEGYG